MVLRAAAILGQRADERRIEPQFVIPQLLGEPEGAGGQVKGPEALVEAQFVRELLLLEARVRVEQEPGGRVDVTAGRGVIIAPAEDVGQLAVADLDFGLVAGEQGFVFIEARVVDREIERVALVDPVVLARRAIALRVEVFQLADHADGFSRAEFQRAAHDFRAGLAMVRTVEQVLEVAAVVVEIGAELEVQLVGHDRAGHHARNREVRAAAPTVNRAVQRSLDLAAEIRGRIAGVDDHRAARGVAAEQDALRTTRDFDRTQVEHVEHQAVVHAHVDAIDEHADGRVDRGDRAVHAQATDREVGSPARGADLIERHVRSAVGQRLKVADLDRFQAALAERGDRERNGLDVLHVLLLGRGNDDVCGQRVDRAAFFFLRKGRGCDRGGQQAGSGEQQLRLIIHGHINSLKDPCLCLAGRT